MQDRALLRVTALEKSVPGGRQLFRGLDLTARAGQLDYRVCELGVRRSYPKGEAVPTKITGAGAKWAIIRQLLGAATGRFHPR